MNVLGECLAKSEPLHDPETQAVRERPRLVGMFEKEISRVVEFSGIGPLDPARLRRFDRLEEWTEQVRVTPRFEECCGFVEYVVRGGKTALSSPCIAQHALGDLVPIVVANQ